MPGPSCLSQGRTENAFSKVEASRKWRTGTGAHGDVCPCRWVEAGPVGLGALAMGRLASPWL